MISSMSPGSYFWIFTTDLYTYIRKHIFLALFSARCSQQMIEGLGGGVRTFGLVD